MSLDLQQQMTIEKWYDEAIKDGLSEGEAKHYVNWQIESEGAGSLPDWKQWGRMA